MSTAGTGLHLSPQEALARDLIMERVAARHRAQRRHRPSRAAVLLRSLADRLDHTDHTDHADRSDHTDRSDAGRAERAAGSGPGSALDSPRPVRHDGPHPGQPRPWSATVRAPHRHSG
ncbi:hypothetical protein [Humibacillus xanthopallidus]|uniref:Uncharacterized protein n=1 Tax=Humibacillus xanthopallidus TaxID=412689 RepID=A0A543HGM9_9MICO|nr:hypothetical protein [Humibacillus xanthopallidus]TQM57478.1 hypothetical protein FBY41_4306 [Humibacillus xanthopallidus]